MRISDWSSDVCSSDLYRVVPRITVQNSDMVFVGYGINAPERGWNDYAGVDVTGKTVVILVNDPDWETAGCDSPFDEDDDGRSEAQTSELQSLMRISYAVLCLKKKN